MPAQVHQRSLGAGAEKNSGPRSVSFIFNPRSQESRYHLCTKWLKLTSMLPTDLRIQELDLSRNLFEDFADVIAIARSLKSLRVLKLKYVRG